MKQREGERSKGTRIRQRGDVAALAVARSGPPRKMGRQQVQRFLRGAMRPPYRLGACRTAASMDLWTLTSLVIDLQMSLIGSQQRSHTGGFIAYGWQATSTVRTTATSYRQGKTTALLSTWREESHAQQWSSKRTRGSDPLGHSGLHSQSSQTRDSTTCVHEFTRPFSKLVFWDIHSSTLTTCNEIVVSPQIG